MNARRQKLTQFYYQNKIAGVELLIDNVWDPHNVAAVSRTADGLGISLIHLYYTYNSCPSLVRKGHKSSAGAARWMRYQPIEDLDEFVRLKKANGTIFLASQKVEGAKDLTLYKFPPKVILMLGSESKGISPELMAIADHDLFIPMVGMAESYNISVAAALCMYEIFKQRKTELDLETLDKLRGER
jgi:tRNA (guanosine-2'-O-)-methyltransferase